MTNKKPSEGEIFIADYLEYQGIKHESEKKVLSLKNDSKQFRRADFYLNDYKVYVEFYGKWNVSKGERERYRNKKRVYHINNIPCVYLYPENLGIIDYCFSKRLVEVLKKNNLKRELFKFRFKRLRKDRGDIVVWLFLTVTIFISSYTNYEENKSLIYVCICVFIFQIYRLIKGYQKFFINTNYHSFQRD